MTVYLVESQVMPQMRARLALAGFGTAALVLTLLFPGAPLPPTHSVLLPLHWALGIAALAGIFVGHGVGEGATVLPMTVAICTLLVPLCYRLLVPRQTDQK